MQTDNNDYEQDAGSESSLDRRIKLLNIATTIALLYSKTCGEQSSQQRPKDSGRGRSNKRQ